LIWRQTAAGVSLRWTKTPDVAPAERADHAAARRHRTTVSIGCSPCRSPPATCSTRTKSIGWELGLPIERHRAAAFRAIRAEVSRLTLEAKQRPVLIVDEAHHLRNEVLEDLRLPTNYQMDSENRLCLLLVGLTELRRRLGMAVHESFAQRIVVRHHLTGEELPAYLTHRLRLAGCELPLFEPPAVEALFQATQGMPRKGNHLAHYALTSATLTQARQVSAAHVQTAREEVAP
jgi:general secretion pathway protein A